MRILVACEESQAVCSAFRRVGHEAYSCDVQYPSGGHPEWHILGDVLSLINGRCTFTTMDGETHAIDGKWDMLIAHPPCTYMTNAGAVRMRVKGKICIENPVPMKLCGVPPYQQIIQPYEYGHPYSKRTCLWLKGLPYLVPTKIISEHEPWVNGGYKDAHGNYRRFQGRKERDPKTRSKTFLGIAAAMADQWGAR